jgi:Tol biopolymer transport system component
MKKLLLLILILSSLPFLAAGQNVVVRRIKPVPGTENRELNASAVSPDGTKILSALPGYKGLIIIDLEKKVSTDIATDPGSGYEPAFSEDSRKVFYRSDRFIEQKKYSSLNEYDLFSGNRKVIQPDARDLKSPVVTKNQVIWSANGNQKALDINPDRKSDADNSPLVMLENLTPVIYIMGKKTVVTPNGPGNYIWASLSPDKSKLLYNFGGTGTYVSDISGKILASAGKINAPRWLTNDVIIGMNDKDDGNAVISSDIVCFLLRSGKTINLTNTRSEFEMYPVPFPDGKKVVFSTVSGGLSIMTLKIRK